MLYLAYMAKESNTAACCRNHICGAIVKKVWPQLQLQTCNFFNSSSGSSLMRSTLDHSNKSATKLPY